MPEVWRPRSLLDQSREGDLSLSSVRRWRRCDRLGAVPGRGRFRLGRSDAQRRRRTSPRRVPADAGAERRQHSLAHDDWAHQRALDLWREAVPIEGTPAEMYLRGVRALQIPEGVSGSALRFHPACMFGHSIKHPCLLALFRSIATNEPMAIARTALRTDATKIDRKSLGPVRGAAIKLSADIVITSNLVIGEGLETVLAGMQLGFAPAWVLGCAGAIAKFSVLGDVGVLTILVDHDDAGMRAAAECSARWTSAGHIVHRIVPRREGQDMADLV
jgi:hypothetical protein